MIVCNNHFENDKTNGEQFVTSEEFWNMATSDAGIQTDSDIYIDVNSVTEDQFNAMKDIDGLNFFTTSTTPEYCAGKTVEEWTVAGNDAPANESSDYLVTDSTNIPDEFKSKNIVTFDKFCELISSDEGINADSITVDVNSFNEEVFNNIKDIDGIEFVSFSDTIPDFASTVNVKVYSNDFTQEISNDSVFNSNSGISVPDEISEAIMNKRKENDHVDETTKIVKEDITNLCKSNESTTSDIFNLINSAADPEYNENVDKETYNNYSARVVTFGSSKGGVGKTFTSVASTNRYAKLHPELRIALLDFDIMDGQVGICIHKIRPTLKDYYKQYTIGNDDFKTLREFSVKAASDSYAKNVDFYLAPAGNYINDNKFWYNVVCNCISNYDLVVFDTGIDYMHLDPIKFAYKCADKINIITTTSIKSVSSVTKQISYLTGAIDNTVYTKEDGLSGKINIIITQMVDNDEINMGIYNELQRRANVIAAFGVITDSIQRCEMFGEWDIFDNNKDINENFDKIME